MFKDKLGRQVELGDRVAVAMSNGNHGASLSFGRVIVFIEPKDSSVTPTMMKILWEGKYNPKYGPSTTNIRADLKKWIIINELTV